MIGDDTLGMYVFLLAFAAAFLLGSRRTLLAVSTRVLLVVLLALAIGYGFAADQWYRAYVGLATTIANVLFVGFFAIDYLAWQKRRLAGE